LRWQINLKQFTLICNTNLICKELSKNNLKENKYFCNIFAFMQILKQTEAMAPPLDLYYPPAAQQAQPTAAAVAQAAPAAVMGAAAAQPQQQFQQFQFQQQAATAAAGDTILNV
jgi:hypothetical protein